MPYDHAQLAMGILVELEHTNDAGVAEQIAKDHLREHPRYYDYLLAAERRMEHGAAPNPAKSGYTVVGVHYRGGDLLPLQMQLKEGLLTHDDAVAMLRQKYGRDIDPEGYLRSRDAQSISLFETVGECCEWSSFYCHQCSIAEIDLNGLAVKTRRLHGGGTHLLIEGRIVEARIRLMPAPEVRMRVREEIRDGVLPESYARLCQEQTTPHPGKRVRPVWARL